MIHIITTLIILVLLYFFIKLLLSIKKRIVELEEELNEIAHENILLIEKLYKLEHESEIGL